MEFRAVVESIINREAFLDRYDGDVDIRADILYAMLDEIDSLRGEVKYLKEIMRDQSFEREYRRD